MVKSGSETNEPTERPPIQNPRAGDATGCPRCFGTGMEMIPGEGARRCDCQISDNDKRLLRAAGIPARYLHCTVSNYDAGESESMWIAKREAQIVIDDYLTLDGRGLLYTGNVGVGKTHLAVGILRELIEHYHVAGLYYSFDALLKEIKSTYNSVSESSEVELLRPVFEAPILVLDELGSTWPTAWVLDTLMYIINSRYSEKRLTIFTTNFRDESNLEGRMAKLKTKLRHLEDLANQKNPEIEEIEREIRKLSVGTLEDRIGTRLRSRLYEMCKSVEIQGEDYRKRSRVHVGS